MAAWINSANFPGLMSKHVLDASGASKFACLQLLEEANTDPEERHNCGNYLLTVSPSYLTDGDTTELSTILPPESIRRCADKLLRQHGYHERWHE